MFQREPLIYSRNEAKQIEEDLKIIQFGEHTINFKGPYKKISILESIKENTGYDLKDMSESETFKIAKKIGVDVDDTMGKGKLIDEIFGEKCRKKQKQKNIKT